NARNEPPRIAQSGFQATVDRVDARAGDLLAVEDTTTLGYPHDSPVELGDLGGPERSTMRGFHVQSVLLVDRESGATVGLVEQRYWTRDRATRGKKRRRCQRAYQDKESFKWQASQEARRARLGERMSRGVSVGDREWDGYEYRA